AFHEARAQGTPVSLLMVDLDRFKGINDAHGHAVGDQVLRGVAAQLPRMLRVQDRLGRLGGEEFLVVLPGANAAWANSVADRMRAALAGSLISTDAGPIRCTVSIGGASRTMADRNVHALIERADGALYRAKAQGRDRVVAAEA